MNKMSLAVFNTQPPHLYFGGVERRILETGRRLSNEFDFKVYSGTKAGFREPTTIDGITIIPCNSTDRIFPLDNWSFNRSIAGIADTIKANVYESHTVSAYSLQKALKKKGINKPFLHTIHGVLADEYAQAQLRGGMSTRGKLANFFMKKLAKIEKESAINATLVVTISKYSQEKILQFYGVDSRKIRIVPNGVDTERFNPEINCSSVKERLKATSRRQIILFVGRLIPRKGLFYLVEAAKRIVKERSETLFVIVGEGPLKSRLMAEVKDANLGNNFTFLGDISESELPAVYGCADVFAFPSIQEGQGIALLEAQSSGKPVVAFDITGIKEAVVEKETGLLVKPESVELAEAILKLLSDDSLRTKMGEQGRNFVQNNFTWDICARRMHDVYLEAIDKVNS
jgi:glycosyltransferase involved in cell wall biosynthesis